MNTAETVELIKELVCRIYATLGGGYSESVYEEAMAVELRESKIPYSVQPTVEVFYNGHKVGEQVLDFLLHLGDFVVELKATASISKVHVAQLAAYMRTTGNHEGMVVSFPPAAKEPLFRRVRPYEVSDDG